MIAAAEAIVRRRTYTLGGAAYARETQTLGLDLKAATKADLAGMLRSIAMREIGAQVRAGNDSFTTEIDGSTSKPLPQAERRVIVVFGARLAARAMALAEAELGRAIAAATVPRSGRLADLKSSWEWLYFPQVGAGRATGRGAPVRNPRELPQFKFGDLLIFRPTDAIPYVWFANRAAVRSGVLTVKRRTRSRSEESRRTVAQIGFMAAAARVLKRRAEFRQFSVYIGFTKQYAPAGVISRHGVPFLVIRLKMRGRARNG